MKNRIRPLIAVLSLNFAVFSFTYAQNDTIKVLAYNVLHYGDYCQGSNTFLHNNLKIIAQFANADVIGLVKVQSIKVTPTDNNGLSNFGFADSIILFAFEPNFPGRYAYCKLTNNALSTDMDVLFYNQFKLGFVSVKTLSTDQEDFDLYKLFYKDPNLSTTHDSTFIYFVLNHTVSGSAVVDIDDRDTQDTLVVKGLQKVFYHLPNLISMGDFNTRTSTEGGYELMVNAPDTSYLFYDPPFGIDHNISYPLNWASNPSYYPAYLTNATRSSATIPNSCGDSGGDKDWYLHMFTSSWIAHNYDYVKYVPNSFNVIGNDGKRLDISVNDTVSRGNNTSAPYPVLNALFELSDKYPVTEKFAITYNTSGTGPANPVNAVQEYASVLGQIRINNPVSDRIYVQFPNKLIGRKMIISWFDITGRLLNSEQMVPEQTELSRAVNLVPGMYILRFQNAEESQSFRIIRN